MSFKLQLAVVQDYVSPRIYSVLVVPDNYVVRTAQLPQLLSTQVKLAKGSVVMIASDDSFTTYIVSILKEAVDGAGLRGNTAETDQQLQPGEVYMESWGDTSTNYAGSGSSLRLGNDGTAEIVSGRMKEFLIIGGRKTDEDGEVVLQGDNGFFQSNPSVGASIQSRVGFDSLNNLRVANDVVSGDVVELRLPVNELILDRQGNITLRNTIGGVENGILSIKAGGDVLLKSTSASLTMASTGAIALTGTTITLNNGALGVARLQDLVTSTPATDQVFWQMVTALYGLVSAYSVLAGGSPAPMSAIGTPALAFLAAAPTPAALVSKITSASDTVKAG